MDALKDITAPGVQSMMSLDEQKALLYLTLRGDADALTGSDRAPAKPAARADSHIDYEA